MKSLRDLKRDLDDRIRGNFQLRIAAAKVRNAARTIAQAGRTVSDIANKPTKLGVAGAAITFLGTYISDVAQHDRQGPPGWEWFNFDCINLRDLLEARGGHATDLPDLYKVDGQLVLLNTLKQSTGWAERSRNSLQTWARGALLEHHGTCLAFDADCTLTACTPHPIVGSPRADALWDRIAPFLTAGLPRSILLDGRPGTGKSTAASYLAHKVGGVRLVVPLGVATHMNTGALSFLKPDTVIIDDFDRLGSDAIRWLSILETLRAHFRLLICTSNNIASLDPAIVRCGRFDEVFAVESLGSDYLRSMLSDRLWYSLSKENQDALLTWPAAFLNELRARFDVLHTDPNLEVASLAPRVENNKRPTWATMTLTNADSLTKKASDKDSEKVKAAA